MAHHALAEEALPPPPLPEEVASVAWQSLLAHFGWYNRQARRCRVAYQALKVVQLVLAASMPVAGAVGAPVWLTALLGTSVILLEGVLQALQLHANWISYRSTAESLRREALLYATSVEPYSEVATRQQILAARLAIVIAGENELWAGAQRTAGRDPRQSTP